MATTAPPNTAPPPADPSEDPAKPPEGIVLPPRDIRTIVEKTAGFVARNGPVFEDRVREKEKTNPKFSFLNPNDAYAPFYQWRLSEIKAGRGTSTSAGRPGEQAHTKEPEKPKGPEHEKPPDFHFSARVPNINALDLDVVNLTALFVAKRGKSFITTLSQKEAGNFQFDFLRPQHSLYQFFTRLVDQYTELLRTDPEGKVAERRRIKELEKNVNNKHHILDRARKRAEWSKFQEQQKQKKEEVEEQEKIAYAQIDWHDFVVVETVVFTEADDQQELPPPTSLNDLQTASLEQKAAMSLAPANRRIEEALPTEDESQNYYNAYPAAQPPPSTAPAPAAAPAAPTPAMPLPETPIAPTAPVVPVMAAAHTQPVPPPTTSPAPAIPTGPGQGQGQGQPPMRIRSDYVPRAQIRRQQAAQSKPMTICPNCRQSIPTDEIEHHMRIELQDPRWREQRAKAEARSATTNLSTNEVVNNLKRLASQRTDVFDPSLGGDVAAPVSRQMPPSAQAQGQGQNQSQGQGQGMFDPEEEARRKRQATGYGVAGGAENMMPPPPPGYPAQMPLPPGVAPGMAYPPGAAPPGTTAPPPGLPAGYPQHQHQPPPPPPGM
ncbi:pre-mRNA splicing factor [Ascosphaera apis ARSEF 7405]|uniref:Pre-mRNA splicing factor n=1 Tax=Ascosphaera apis ARSEF 7405 TaxID=392613 RepID=A0A167UVV5_9EURO|nr:pre-mRNA splicing factor [Ascosphaera apis ARSEF 7405]